MAKKDPRVSGIIFAILSFIIGLLAVLGARRDLRRRKRVRDTPTSRIADVRGGEAVEIAGTIVAGDEGALKAPLTGRDVVWYELMVREQHGKSSKEIKTETAMRRFAVDDGSGELAIVDPKNAHLVVTQPSESFALAGTLSPEHAALFARLGVMAKLPDGTVRRLRVTERVLRVGGRCFALGPTRREPGPPVPGAYRTTATTRVVLAASGAGEEQELIVSDADQKKLESNLGCAWRFGWVLLFLCAVLVTVLVATWR